FFYLYFLKKPLPALQWFVCLSDWLKQIFVVKKGKKKMKENVDNPLHLKSLNHVSLVCRSVEESINFYQNILGFVPIRRPGSFDFNGAWLFGYGIGIHLLQSEDPDNMPKKKKINPKDNHISFQLFLT
ncbi:Glyoxalase/fosfomycin resistance/dioxygenase domain - like 6, partial [Theobroma cacao]